MIPFYKLVGSLICKLFQGLKHAPLVCSPHRFDTL